MNTLSRWFALVACVLLCTPLFAGDEKTPGSAEGSIKEAKDWLAHVDAGQYAESWQQAGSRFRATVTAAKWTAAMEQVRQPLGSVASRESIEAAFAHEAPRAPKGDYWILKFATKFEAIAAHEVVILAAEADGTWRVVGYFIKPAT